MNIYIFNEYIFGFWTKWALLSKLTNRSSIFQPGDARHWESWGLTWQGHVWTTGVVSGLPGWTLQDWWNCGNVRISRWGISWEGPWTEHSQRRERQQDCLPTMNRQSECPVHLSGYIGDFAGVRSIICHLRTKNKLMALRIWFRSNICQHSKFNSIQLAFKAFQVALSWTPFFFLISMEHICVCVRVCVCGDSGDL